MKKKLSELAAELSITHKNFDLVTVKGRNYYVWRSFVQFFKFAHL